MSAILGATFVASINPGRAIRGAALIGVRTR
jgi:hypothetical protein